MDEVNFRGLGVSGFISGVVLGIRLCVRSLGGSPSTDSALFSATFFLALYFSSLFSSLLFPAVISASKNSAHGVVREDSSCENRARRPASRRKHAHGVRGTQCERRRIRYHRRYQEENCGTFCFVRPLKSLFLSFKVDVRYSHYPHPNEYKKKLGNDVGRHHVRPAFTGVWAQRNQVREDVLRRPRARRNRADARRLLRTSLD